MAGRFPIKRAIGVELQADLTEIAQRNVARAQPRMSCRDFELVTADVLDWPVPDDLSIVFMYCPFLGELFSAAMDRLIAPTTATHARCTSCTPTPGSTTDCSRRAASSSSTGTPRNGRRARAGPTRLGDQDLPRRGRRRPCA